MDYRVLERSGHFSREESPDEQSLHFKHLGSSRDKFRLGTFGVHHQVCIDEENARTFHDTWIAVGEESTRGLSLADYAIGSWFDSIVTR